MNYGQVAEADIHIPESLRKKTKKPNIFKRWLYKWVKDAYGSEEKESRDMKMASAGLQIARGPDRAPSLDSDKGIRFQVYRAQGGFVIETAIYDRQRDRHNNSLHIVTDDQDLGEQIGKIITLEALRS